MGTRRTFLQTASGLSMIEASTAGDAVPPTERLTGLRLTREISDRVHAGYDAILNELKPSKAQIDRGLDLHYGSYVADVQGGIPAISGDWTAERLGQSLATVREELKPAGLTTREIAKRLAEARRRWKAFESAFDPQWRENVRGLYQLAGIKLACEDVAHPDENSFESALTHLARSRFVYDVARDVVVVAGMEDLRRAKQQGKTGVVLHLAAVGCWAESKNPIEYLDLFFAFGIRMSQLTYIQDNAMGSSYFQDNDKGLTTLGRAAVRRMNQLGIMLDIAHAGPQTALDAIEASDKPALLSHIACLNLHDDTRDDEYLRKVLAQPYAKRVPVPKKTMGVNVRDEVLRAIAKKGGVAAVLTLDHVLGRGSDAKSFNTWFRHVEHVIKVAGIDQVAIGTDRTFFLTWKPAPMDWTNWPYWTVGLVCRGFSDEEIRKIIGGNYFRCAEAILSAKPWGALI